jgi:hypothetical protein
MDPNDGVHHVSQAHYSILNMFSPGRASVPSVIAPTTLEDEIRWEKFLHTGKSEYSWKA